MSIHSVDEFKAEPCWDLPAVKGEEHLPAHAALIHPANPALYSLLKKDDPASPRPAGQAAFAAFSAARVITGFRVDHGNVSADGQVAVVNGEMTLRADGEDAFITGYPLRLERENGLWKISYKRLLALMNQE